MDIQTFTDGGEFLKHVQPFLEQKEAINNLILGITIRIAETPDWFDGQPYMASIDDRLGQPILTAEITPPFNMLLAAADDVPQEAIDRLMEDLRSKDWPLPGVSAENPLAHRFVESWSRATGQPHYIKMRKRVYELREVIPPPVPPAGFLRLATMEDFDLVLEWRNAFARESLHEEPPSNASEQVERNIRDENVFLWEDGGPVSMANRARPTPHGYTVNSVYTPPDHRGRGYASACVAALSQRLLDSGKQFCTLFTDLDYPTSNSIYQKIGYRPLCDFTDYVFI